MTNHAAQLAIIKHVTRQESRSSAGNCHADEPAGITQLSRPRSRDSAGTDHVADQVQITHSGRLAGGVTAEWKLDKLLAKCSSGLLGHIPESDSAGLFMVGLPQQDPK